MRIMQRDDPSMKWVQKFVGKIGGNSWSGVLKMIKMIKIC